MTDDLVKRLREVGGISDDGATRWYINPDGPEAADRIKKLEAEVKRLEQQLKMARRLAYRPQPEYPPEIGVPHLKED